MNDFFDENRRANMPLAERMRCNSLDDFVGQNHIVGEGSLLRRAIKADRLGSCIFYGTPGVGKTTLANIIAKTTNSHYFYLNAVSSGVSDAKKIIEEAKNTLAYTGKQTYLFLDECHRWSKAQSDCVLSAIEKGEIIFIGSTTENPFVSMTKAIVSRCRIFEFRPLANSDVKKAIFRAIKSKDGLGDYDIELTETALNHLCYVANGDLRVALNSLELAVITTQSNKDGKIIIDEKIIEQSTQKPIIGTSESEYYDFLSGFCKSLRGSDPDASLFYAFRLIYAGCDPLIIARRLIVHSAEDVGMADPFALTMATNAMFALEKIGMPEARIPLAEAIIYVCKAPKSNSVYLALAKAEKLAKEGHNDMPSYLKDTNYKTEKITGYKYPHDFGGYVEQQYLPNSIKNEVFYEPTQNGMERRYQGIWKA